ncbi:MAG: DinB family protein [Candidatus Bipolaricaulota bacterium]|nr:DinB family protein [Candidatus Bipolaricaulota bacterium]MDW8031092.1 DinB family protein [Candidatus Bipolaricaulota bacterium]
MPKKKRVAQTGQAEWLLKAMELAFQKKRGLWAHSMLDTLEGITAEQATWKPDKKGVHSIWEIVHHATYWKDFLVQRLEGSTAKFSDEESWALKETTEEAWAQAVVRLKRTHTKLIRRLREKKLDLNKPFPGEKMTMGEALFGVLAHDLYHTGQIVLLRQMQGIEP